MVVEEIEIFFLDQLTKTVVQWAISVTELSAYFIRFIFPVNTFPSDIRR